MYRYKKEKVLKILFKLWGSQSYITKHIIDEEYWNKCVNCLFHRGGGKSVEPSPDRIAYRRELFCSAVFISYLQLNRGVKYLPQNLTPEGYPLDSAPFSTEAQLFSFSV